MTYRITGALVMGLLLMLTPAAAAGWKEATADERQRVPVTIARVEARVVEDWRASVGQLEAQADPLVSAEVAGRLKEVLAREGDVVKAGQVLARIDDADYLLARDAARADIERVRALLRAAGLRLKRVQRLVKRGTAPTSQLDDARARHDSLRAQLAAARVRLAQAERNLEKTRVISPVDGRVSRRMVSPGDLMAAGKPMFRLSAPGYVKVRLPFPERDLAVIRTGQPLELSTPAMPGKVVRATVQKISPDIDPASRAIHVLAVLRNEHGWRIGGSVDGRVLVARRDHALVAPEQAVVLRPGGHVVFTVDDGDIARMRKVRPGLKLDGLVEILDGLKEGERIAADGAGFLSDGVAVEVRP